MSFLRKRSRSQSSGFNGEDDCNSMRGDRKDSNRISLVERRYSGVSETSSRPDDYDLHESCVIRNFPKHKSSHLRFLAWVAYTRKYDDSFITDDERRTCPLLWCREVFADQESMLKHVWECEHLSKGLYWCFHCQKPERVGKFQCKRCQGLPSKTDRLTTVAKRIFSKLGTKHHRDEYSAAGSEMGLLTSMALSKIPETTESEHFPDVRDSFDHEEFPPYEPLPELPNNVISEMENNFVMPEMDSSWNISSQELSKPYLSEKRPVENSTGLYSNVTMNSSKNAFSESHPPWSPSSFEPQAPAQKSPGRSLPALALNTRDIYQPPSSRHRYGHIGTLSDEPLSATVISPLSATDGFFSGMLGMSARDFEVSPTESEATCNSLFTADSGYSSATIDSAMSATSMNFDPKIWDTLDVTKRSDYQVFPMASETDMASEAGLMLPPSQPLSASSSNVPSRSSSNSSNHSANRCTALVKRKTLSPHWTDSKSLVESFVEVLDEHLQHSRAALKQLPSNSTIKELLSMSSASIISIGFDSLRGLLEKRNPTAIISIFAFAHVAYACAIAVDDKLSKVRADDWFQDSLAWLSGLSSERQRMSYTLIVQAIWKPQDLVDMGDFVDLHAVSDGRQASRESENRLFKACKHFLDIQENLSNNQKFASHNFASESSPFSFSQVSFQRMAKSRIIDELIQKVSIEAFIEDVVAVEKRLREGPIKDLRQLELELICAGKLASQSDIAYERFLSHVTCLCDTLYSEGESDKSRTTYQIEDIDAVKTLIPEEVSGDEDNNLEDEDFDFEQLINGHSVPMDFGSSDASVEAFDMDANGILDDSYFTNPIPTPMTSTPLARSHSNPNPSKNPFRQSHIPPPSSSAAPSKSPFPPPPTPISAPAPQSFSTPSTSVSSSSEKNKYKCHCGYVPKGEEKWFPSNLARHKRTQHPVEVKVYKCRFPGCASTFTRSDNLRSHVRDKGHESKGEDVRWNGFGDDGEGKRDREGWEEGRKPSKRRKIETPVDLKGKGKWVL